MRKLFSCFFSVLAVCLFVILPSAKALQIPKSPDGYVTDRAGLLSSSAKADLEALLRSFEEKTSNQVVVAIFPSLESESLEDFSIRLAETWKIGQKGRDNGVIFLIFPQDRQMRIEVGYGLEGVLTDAVSGQIIRQIVAPYFRKGDYEGGISAGVNAIFQATQGEFKAIPGKDSANDFAKILILLMVLFFLHFWIRMNAFGIRGGSGYYSGGGFRSRGFGGGGFSGGGGGFGGGGASGRW